MGGVRAPKGWAGGTAQRAGRAALAALLLSLAWSAEAAQEAAPRPAPSVVAAANVMVETDQGSFVIRLLAEVAPGHARHFVETAKAGGYDGTAFHRIVPGGIVQGGDPLTRDPRNAARYGTGGLGLLKAEFSDRPFTRGTVAAARRPSSKDSGGSQFFICLTDQPALKGQYTIFGEVIEGMDVVDKIGQTPVQGDKPQARIEIKKASIRGPAGP
jgi:peptidyl-prolyl cis-trans isomerase B (cyclophilin B)